ncbi:hypothetical protein CERZMDRAFT_97634 [Cercospora zeae-maydis SCOH1-5]|uniref:Uncharacterized protein n=1 Tax=Cercospora zeae-maydis SCOH1-5 TaxID=717836 RepID=A0A6A6FGI9_9PEZI|nr:hypothetical protein CERZMDRAFT_97634 [Cercospora zeae-maydis SCOH1-5]
MHILDRIKNWSFLRRLLFKVPGPLLAKFTRLWKLWHLLRGTYKAKLQQLHALHGESTLWFWLTARALTASGPLIQVAPREVSWQFTPANRKQLLDLEKRSSPATNVIEPKAARSLLDCFQMERLNHNEHMIDLCNALLRCVLMDAAQKQRPVDLSNLLNRHAFDVMFAVTTGERAGFLDNTPNADKICSKLESWKFYAVLYGSYLRYHPLLKAALPIIRCRSQGQTTFDPALEVLNGGRLADPAGTDPHNDGDGSYKHKLGCVGSLEARAALAIAGADPAVSLSLEVLKAVSANEKLQRLLLTELTGAGLTNNTTFQELSTRKLHMPHLNALIQHHMRQLGLHDMGLSYVSPAGGMELDQGIVTAGHTIHVTSNDSAFAEGEIDSFEALDFGLAPELQRHLPAYNLWTPDHKLQDCHFLLVSKLLAMFLQNFDIKSIDNGVQVIVAHKVNENTDSHQLSTEELSSEDDKISDATTLGATSSNGASDHSRKATVTPSDMDILGENFGPTVTDELFRLFDPSPKSVYRYDVLRVGPIKHSAARYMVHRALSNIYGVRIKHKVDVDEIICIAAKHTRWDFNERANPRAGFKPRKRVRYAVVRPWYKECHEARRPRPVNEKWGGWAAQEHQKSIEAKSEESYLLQQQARVAIDASGTKIGSISSQKPFTFKETYKQTTGGSDGTGPRKVLRVETTIHDGNGSITTSSDGVALAQTSDAAVPAAPAPRPEGWVPPHVRARQERERHASEAAAAAEMAKQTPLPISPELEPSTPDVEYATTTSNSDSPRSSTGNDNDNSPFDPTAPAFATKLTN